jgi:hypothetical protein
VTTKSRIPNPDPARPTASAGVGRGHPHGAFKTQEEMKQHAREGLGGVLGLVIWIVIRRGLRVVGSPTTSSNTPAKANSSASGE